MFNETPWLFGVRFILYFMAWMCISAQILFVGYISCIATNIQNGAPVNFFVIPVVLPAENVLCDMDGSKEGKALCICECMCSVC